MNYLLQHPQLQSCNISQFSNISNENISQLYMETEALKARNRYLLNILREKTTELDRLTGLKNVEQFDSFKGVTIMMQDLKTMLEEKMNAIKDEQQIQRDLISDIWNVNFYKTLSKKRKSQNEEECTKKDFEIDNEILKIPDICENQSLNIFNDTEVEEELNSQVEKIFNEYNQMEMETQTDGNFYFHEEVNNCQTGNAANYKPMEMETQYEDISDDDHSQNVLKVENVINEFFQTEIDTRKEENLRYKYFEPVEQCHEKTPKSPKWISVLETLHKYSDNDHQLESTVDPNYFESLSFPAEDEEEDKENFNLVNNVNSQNQGQEKIILTMFSCKFCDKKYVSKGKLDAHNLSHKTKQCEDCGKSFLTNDFNRHQMFSCTGSKFPLRS